LRHFENAATPKALIHFLILTLPPFNKRILQDNATMTSADPICPRFGS